MLRGSQRSLLQLFGNLKGEIGDDQLRPGAAEIYGKVATFVFYAVMVLVIAFGPEIGALRAWFTLPTPAMVVLVILSAALTVVALLSYAPATFRQFKEKKQNSTPKKDTEE